MSQRNGFLLGAGFSKYGGIPLLKEFYSIAKEIIQSDHVRQKYDKDGSANIYQLLLDSYSIVRQQEDISENIEELFQYANPVRMNAYSRGDGRDWSNIDKQIKDAVVKIINVSLMKILDSKDRNIKLDYYLRFLDLVVQTDNQPIITTNYDNLIELLMHTAAMSDGQLIKTFLYNKIDHSLESLGGDQLEVYSGDTIVKYYKIHGSLNWWYCENHGVSQVADLLNTSFSGSCKKCHNPTQPLVVYPGGEKWQNSNLRILQVLAFEHLNEVDRIITIGFNFNAADTHITCKINDMLRSGKKLIIIDPKATEIKNRCGFSADCIPASFEDVFSKEDTPSKMRFQELIQAEIRPLVNFEVENPADPYIREHVYLRSNS